MESAFVSYVSQMASGEVLRREDVDVLLDVRRRLARVGEESDTHALVRETVATLRELLGAEQTIAYALAPDDVDHNRIDWMSAHGEHTALWNAELPRYIRQSPTPKFGLFDPSRPEPEQRNQVVAWTRDEMRELVEQRRAPILEDLYPRAGADRRSQIRVLLCDGPSLLAWVGGWREEAFSDRDAFALRVVGSAMRRRLRLERRLDRDRARATLDAVLEGVGGLVFVVGSDGRILEANLAARAELDRAPSRTAAELAEAIRHGAHPRWSVSPLALRAGPRCHLVIARPEHPDSAVARIDAAAKAWALTKRQRQVLEKLAEGNANRTIGAMLGIAERTVELHVTALFEKAQVENRAELVAVLHTRF